MLLAGQVVLLMIRVSRSGDGFGIVRASGLGWIPLRLVGGQLAAGSHANPPGKTPDDITFLGGDEKNHALLG